MNELDKERMLEKERTDKDNHETPEERRRKLFRY